MTTRTPTTKRSNVAKKKKIEKENKERRRKGEKGKEMYISSRIKATCEHMSTSEKLEL